MNHNFCQINLFNKVEEMTLLCFHSLSKLPRPILVPITRLSLLKFTLPLRYTTFFFFVLFCFPLRLLLSIWIQILWLNKNVTLLLKMNCKSLDIHLFFLVALGLFSGFSFNAINTLVDTLLLLFWKQKKCKNL